MEKNNTLKFLCEKFIFSLPVYSVGLGLLFPLIFFCFRLKSIAWPEIPSLAKVVFFTTFQSGMSSILSLTLALLGSCGLLSLSKKKYYFFIEGLVLLPCFIPPLLLVLSLVSLTEKIINFPFGLGALIFTQTLTYTGLCSVALTRILLKEAGPLSEWAYLHNISSWRFLKVLCQSLLLKDIKTLFILVFSACWTSLSLPLLTAGSMFFSLEFFIYEKLKDPALWPQALSLILFQSFFIFFICWRAFSGKTLNPLTMSSKKIYLISHGLFLLIPFSALFFSIGGLFAISDIKFFSKLVPFRQFILSSGLNSVIVSLGVGFFTLLALMGLSLSFQNVKARKFVASFVSPGVSFIGFALLVVPFYGKLAVICKWVLGLSLLLFPWLYRFRGERALEKLNSQVETARFLGAGWGLIFQKILWPANRSIYFLCAGLASFWACGDFAYSLIVSSGHWNLSLMLYDLFSSYRLEEGIILAWLLLFVGAFVFLFWLGVAFVFDKKPVL